LISHPDSFAPAGAWLLDDPDPRLTPWAIIRRPSGASRRRRACI